MFVLQWLLRSCPNALHNLIEIILPLFKTTVLIYKDKQAWPWPCSALTWIAAPALSKVPSINSGFSLAHTSHFLVIWKCFLFSFLARFFLWHLQREKEKTYVNSTSVNSQHLPLFRLTSDIDYIMLCWLGCFPPFVAIIRRCAQSQSLSPFTVKEKKSTSAIMRRAMAVATMMAFFTGTHGFETLKSCF